ncbi:MAG: NAD(P)H-hydrate dehydratase [Desulfurococcales archaeon]|nr:NAD(P)H-hydrate dehydratase [Desulfurococcales archaeon]
MSGCPGLYEASPEDAVSVEHVRASELNGVYLGVPLLLLMESAGRSVADAIECKLGSVKGKSVHILAGKGGNAGDGFVAGRHLALRGAKVVVHLSSRAHEVTHPDARLNLEALIRAGGVRVLEPGKRGWLDLSTADVIVDAMLGIGVRGALRGRIRDMADAMNESGGLRVAIDTPTGLNPDTGEAVEGAVRADLTVTMGWAKRGLFMGKAPLYTGEVLVAEIGLPREAEIYAGPGDVIARLPDRPRDAHKGVGGRVLIVAGSKYYVGAAILSAGAATRSGVDLVYLSSVKGTAVEAASRFSSVIPVPYKGDILSADDIERVVETAAKAHSILIGPGLGAEEETLEAVARLYRELRERWPDKPIVMDADALKAIDRIGELDELTIITPHRGEARRLHRKKSSDDLKAIAEDIAKTIGATVLLKAPHDIICSPRGPCRVNRSGVPAMSVGGTGDVLSGIVAGFLARRASKGLDPDPLNTAAAAAFLTGLAGEMAYELYGEAMTASDVLEVIPKALTKCRELVTHH